jgi:hypothetical protein
MDGIDVVGKDDRVIHATLRAQTCGGTHLRFVVQTISINHLARGLSCFAYSCGAMCLFLPCDMLVVDEV